MDEESDIRHDPAVWAALAVIVERGGAIQTEIQEATGLSLVWVTRTRQLLEAWGLTTSEEQFEGRVRYRVSYPTEHGRRVHKLRTELDALILKGREDVKRSGKKRG